jgi:hypothetical protein
MERAKLELMEQQVVDSTDDCVFELDQAQLALIGGGSGDPILY